MLKITKGDLELFSRNVIFGVEDSLVSTVGLLSGVAVAGVSRAGIFSTGMILIFVEAFSMGVGSFLSESSVEEYEKKKDLLAKPFFGAVVMFISYFLAGLVPIFPYVFLDKFITEVSVGITFLALFFLGIFSARFLKINIWRQAIRMVLMGGAAILVGSVVGNVFKI